MPIFVEDISGSRALALFLVEDGASIFVASTILVTHDQIEATTMADRVVCMNKGRIEQVGTAEDLYLRPVTRFVAGFIGSPPINLLDLPAPGMTGQGAAMGIRPEMILAAETGLPATITAVERMGREALMHAQTPAGELRFLEATSQPRWSVGERLHLTFDPADTIVFDAAGRRLDAASVQLAALHA